MPKITNITRIWSSTRARSMIGWGPFTSRSLIQFRPGMSMLGVRMDQPFESLLNPFWLKTKGVRVARISVSLGSVKRVSDAVVPCVEPDERLPPGGRTIGSRVNEDGLVDRIARSRFECVLDPALGENVIAGRAFVDGDTSRERPALAQAPNGNDACRH